MSNGVVQHARGAVAPHPTSAHTTPALDSRWSRRSRDLRHSPRRNSREPPAPSTPYRRGGSPRIDSWLRALVERCVSISRSSAEGATVPTGTVPDSAVQ